MEIKCERCRRRVGDTEVVFNRHCNGELVEAFVCLHCLEEELARKETDIKDLKELLYAVKKNLRDRESERGGKEGRWLC